MSPGTDALAPACLHADDALLVFDKPAGLLSVPGRGVDKQDCLIARAQLTWPDALIVHRLDMATSGLIVVARGAASQRRLSQAFEARRVTKRYEAVVQGHLKADSGEIDLPLMTDWPRRPRQMVSPEGRPSLTRWRVLQRFEDPAGQPCTRLQLEPVTGRSHQLRVHLQAIGHPIVGDPLYAGDHAATQAPRLLLHACALGLQHPVQGDPRYWDSPAPF